MTRSRAGTPSIIRGRIYGAELGDLPEKYYLAVSNNQRNARLGTFLAVRLTTTRKPPLPSIVQLGEVDAPWTGAISADDIDKIYVDEVTRDYGALPPKTLRRVDEALRAALAL
jgi:mRNA interferase MazF